MEIECQKHQNQLGKFLRWSDTPPMKDFSVRDEKLRKLEYPSKEDKWMTTVANKTHKCENN